MSHAVPDFPTPDTGALLDDPIARFHHWWNEAKAHPQIPESTAMTLATATSSGAPSARIVLLKSADAEGFVWFTNAQSRKGNELQQNPQAALCFYWMPLRKQVRVEGRAVPTREAESDAYFNSRPRDSQIGAWASLQSQPLDTRATFETRIREYETKFSGQDVPRPPHWHGWRLVPEVIEFWTERPFRLHDREVYTASGNGTWAMHRLYP
jgi:pyridoxamine 5'-phosphate oxidase